MIKILFVCHGNICRSPMAESIFKYMTEEKGVADKFEISSAATSTEAVGCGVHRETSKKLAEVGIPCVAHTARQVKRSDYDYYDLLIIMDELNRRWLKRIIPDDPENKIHMLLEYTGESKDVADPWYTGDFDITYNDITRGCRALLAQII